MVICFAVGVHQILRPYRCKAQQSRKLEGNMRIRIDPGDDGTVEDLGLVFERLIVGLQILVLDFVAQQFIDELG